jgi:endonuclease/exonuclease/phosphatase (EEP) superfamily protein YafD
MRPLRALQRTFEAIAGVTLLATALPIVSAHWWVLDLFTHFRLQLIAIQLGLFLLLAVVGRSIWMPILALALGVNVAASWDYLMPRARDVQAAPSIRIMEANVRARNTRFDGLLAQIEQTQPDVVVVIEYTVDWGRRLAPLEVAYPYRVEALVRGRFGIAMYSRTPILDEHVFDLENAPAIDARIDVAGEAVRIIAVHTVAQLAGMTATAIGPLIVVGDLNLTPFSARFGEFLDAAGLRDATVGRGPRITWPTFFPPLGIPIDHCLLGPDWDSIAYRREPAYGSDHYAIVVDLIKRTAP